MTPDEKSALRAKHRPCHHEGHAIHKLGWCEVCEKPWPCEVMQVLDAWALEEHYRLIETGLCDHAITFLNDDAKVMTVAYETTYCPNCGAKLGA